MPNPRKPSKTADNLSTQDVGAEGSDLREDPLDTTERLALELLCDPKNESVHVQEIARQ